MICGLTSITSGSIFINGYSIDKNFQKAISSVGAVVEYPQLYPYLTGKANLKLFASFYGKSAKARIPNIIKILKMEDFINKKVSTYSLGMKQRLGIAQAMLNKPRLLILDEPTNGLDPNGIKDIRNLLQTLAKKEKMAIIISSHNLSELEQICNQIAVIRLGKLLSFKNMEDISKDIENNQQVCLQVNYPNYFMFMMGDELARSSTHSQKIVRGFENLEKAIGTNILDTPIVTKIVKKPTNNGRTMFDFEF